MFGCKINHLLYQFQKKPHFLGINSKKKPHFFGIGDKKRTFDANLIQCFAHFFVDFPASAFRHLVFYADGDHVVQRWVACSVY